MKVLYDFQTFNNQQYGGISRYYYELMNHFRKSDDIQFDLGLKYTHNHYATHSDFLKVKVPNNRTIDDMLWGINFKGKGKLFRYYSKLFNVNIYKENRKIMVNKLEKGDFDVFHPTYFNDYFLPYLGNKPFVLTIYDMAHEIFAETLLSVVDIKEFESKRMLAQQATKIIAISENTKRDIIGYYGVNPDKIEVIHLANSLDPETENPNLQLPEKYVLYVGNRNFYKNFYVFAAAMARLMQKDKDLYVVCAGGGQIYEFEKRYLKMMGVEDRFISAPADDASLVIAYKNSLAFVYPSLYEGFGIPVLEAFACGAPVVASNISSLPEIGGGAAEYFEPKDIDSMSGTIAKVIYDPKLRSEMIIKGYTQEKQFSWAKTAEATKSLYKSLI
jgi:glycosyltransferase involved in cell wall biosynthesis